VEPSRTSRWLALPRASRPVTLQRRRVRARGWQHG
jgi:hypothetical protein